MPQTQKTSPKAEMKRRDHHLVHANIAIARAPLDDPLMADFVDQADEIDALAQGAPGFVSQPTPSDEGQIYSGATLLNLSMWESVESLEQFALQGRHALALERRAEWFEQHEGPNYVLYWAGTDHAPTEAEVKGRIDYLAKHGPTPYAFTFDQPFTVAEMLAYRPEAPAGNVKEKDPSQLNEV